MEQNKISAENVLGILQDEIDHLNGQCSHLIDMLPAFSGCLTSWQMIKIYWGVKFRVYKTRQHLRRIRNLQSRVKYTEYLKGYNSE